MRKYKSLLLTFIVIFSASLSIAQAPVKINVIPISDAPTIGELAKLVATLEKSNTALQKQVDALQIQVNANYKAQDFVIGLLQKKTDALTTSLAATDSKIDAVAGRSPAAFTVTAGAANLTDMFTPPVNTLSGKYYRSVIIDNSSCNNNPGAIVLAVSQTSNFGYNLPAPVAVTYDKSINKWKIVINPDGTNNTITGLAKPTTGSSMVSVLSYNPYQIENGDKFNVQVIK